MCIFKNINILTCAVLILTVGTHLQGRRVWVIHQTRHADRCQTLRTESIESTDFRTNLSETPQRDGEQNFKCYFFTSTHACLETMSMRRAGIKSPRHNDVNSMKGASGTSFCFLLNPAESQAQTTRGKREYHCLSLYVRSRERNAQRLQKLICPVPAVHVASTMRHRKQTSLPHHANSRQFPPRGGKERNTVRGKGTNKHRIEFAIPKKKAL